MYVIFLFMKTIAFVQVWIYMPKNKQMCWTLNYDTYIFCFDNSVVKKKEIWTLNVFVRNIKSC